MPEANDNKPNPLGWEDWENKSTSHTGLMESISGTEVQVVFEFPSNDVQKSIYIHMPNIITISHSVSRSKIPVTTLGQTTLSGMALGGKMVAGSIVKLAEQKDKLSSYISAFVDERSEKMSIAHKNTIADFSHKMHIKEISDYMRDDISPFNIHLIAISEYAHLAEEIGPTIDTIIGATIINMGKVFSIENLITEETLSFVAKTVHYHNDLSKPLPGSDVYNFSVTGTDIVQKLRQTGGVVL